MNATNGRTRTPRTFSRSGGITRSAHKVLLYGTGGCGKTSLASLAPGVLFIDLEGGTQDMNVLRLCGVASWSDLRAATQHVAREPDDVATLVIDSASKAEEMAVAHVLENVQKERGGKAERIEDYGWGKGYVYVFEEWRRWLADLEQAWQAGINIVLIAHEQIATAPNPNGEDFKRYQPRLQSSERANIAAVTKEWADHVAFISYDVMAKEKKGIGSGSRTIYMTETPAYMAKTRSQQDTPIVFSKGTRELWDRLMPQAEESDIV